MFASILLASSLGFFAHAAPNSKNTQVTKTLPASPLDCIQIEDSVDRKYCFDKHLQSIQKGHETEKKSWEKGLGSEAKEKKIAKLTTHIENTKELIGMLQSEITMNEQLLTELNALSSKKSVAKKKKKKN